MTGLADAFPEAAHLRAAERALAVATDKRPRTVDHLGRGNRKRTAVVRFADRDPVVVQVCDDPRWLETEAVLLEAIRERTQVPVPAVLAAGTVDGVAYATTAYVPGDDLHERFVGFSRERQRALAAAFGEHLGALHDRFRFDGHGQVAVVDDELRAAGQDWGDWLRQYGRNAIARLPEEFDELRGDLEGLFADAPGGPAPAARLYPWDFRPGNALVADGELAAVLDWEAPLAAAPALSVAKAEYLVADWYVDDPDPLRAAFVAGYERRRPHPDVDVVHRAAAIADSAVDSTGTVTNPRYPELDRDGAIAFHRDALADLV